MIVDGNDVLAVRRVTQEAAARARRGEGATLIEAKTYRHRGHFEGDMARYRPKDEVAEWMARDPLVVYPRWLTAELGATEADLNGVRTRVESRLEQAIEWAKEQEHPQPADALDDVYVDSLEGAALR